MLWSAAPPVAVLANAGQNETSKQAIRPSNLPIYRTIFEKDNKT